MTSARSPAPPPLARVLAAARDGEMVVLLDDDEESSEAVLVMAAEKATSDEVAFFVRYTSGVICVALTGERCDALGLPLMVADDTDYRRAAFTHSVDHRVGTTTGISASDRAVTVRALADPDSTLTDFSRPGHLFPLRARDGGVLKRVGRPEAAVDLVGLAGLRPAAMLCGLVNEDGSMATGPALESFAATHHLPMVSITELLRHRQMNETLVAPNGTGRVPTRWGTFAAHAYRSLLDDTEHVAFVMGAVAIPDPVLVWIHRGCVLGDIFGSLRCDCRRQLDQAMARIGERGRGVVVYLRDPDGPGGGLGHEVTVEAPDAPFSVADLRAAEAAGAPRGDSIAMQILEDLGVQRTQLLVDGEGPESPSWPGGPEIVERYDLAGPAARRGGDDAGWSKA